MPAYVPPALRSHGNSESQAKLPDRVWTVKLQCTAGGSFATKKTSCPQELELESTEDHLEVHRFDLPYEVSTAELRELFAWFADASSRSYVDHPDGDPRAHMCFPSTLSKDTRKLLHQLAEGLGLPTMSSGVGDDRHLIVHSAAYRATAEADAEAAAAAARRNVPKDIRERAKQLWKWCQAEGGALWNVSQGELVEALLMAPDEQALPPAVKELAERRLHGLELIAAIKRGDTATALSIVGQHPKAIWMREDPIPGAPADADHGFYPLHLAALNDMGDVVDVIASLPGAVDQRDKLYATPLKVAKKGGHSAMVEILLRHGARDFEISQPAHKVAPMGYSGSTGSGGSAATGRSRRNSQLAHDGSNHGYGCASPHTGSRNTSFSQAPASPAQGQYQQSQQAARRARRHSQEAGPGGHLSGSSDPSHPRSRRNSQVGRPPRPPAGAAAAGAPDADSGGSGSNTPAGTRGGSRSGFPRLPPIQSGEISDAMQMLVLREFGASQAPKLATTAETGAPEGAEAAAVAAGTAVAAAAAAAVAAPGDESRSVSYAGDDGEDDDGTLDGQEGEGGARRRRRRRRNRRHSMPAGMGEPGGGDAGMDAAEEAVEGMDKTIPGKSAHSAIARVGPMGAEGPNAAGSGASASATNSLLSAFMAGRKGLINTSVTAGSSAGGSFLDDDSDDSQEGEDGRSPRIRKRGGRAARERRHARRAALREAEALGITLTSDHLNSITGVAASGGSMTSRLAVSGPSITGAPGVAADAAAGTAAAQNRSRRTSAADYSSFQGGKHAHAHGHGSGAAAAAPVTAAAAGHHGHSHADDASSWRRADSPMSARSAVSYSERPGQHLHGTSSPLGYSPHGHSREEPREPREVRDVRAASAVMQRPHSPLAYSLRGGGAAHVAASNGGGAAAVAPVLPPQPIVTGGGALRRMSAGPFTPTSLHALGPKEHVALGPPPGAASGGSFSGFGFGRGRGRGLAPGGAPASPIAPGSAPSGAAAAPLAPSGGTP